MIIKYSGTQRLLVLFFDQDQVRVWSYFAQYCIDTTGWQIIKKYQPTRTQISKKLYYGQQIDPNFIKTINTI